MTEKESFLGDLSKLRKQAEALVDSESKRLPELSPGELRNLFHELRTHQIELELQNEELRRAQEELVDSRNRYTHLYDFAPVGYLTLSEKGMIRKANLSFTDMVGVERQRALNSPISGFILPQDQDIYYKHRKKLLDTGERQSCEMRLKRIDGSVFWARVECTCVESEEEGDLQFRSIISDISREKKAEEEKQGLEAQLQQKQRLEAIGTLASGVAHEINNPLMGMINYAQLILDELTDETLKEYGTGIIDEGNRITVIVKSLLSFARKDLGPPVLEYLQDIINDSFNLLSAVLRHDNITVERDVPDDLPVLLCRGQQLEQVLVNLLVNARDALNERYHDYHRNKILRVSACCFNKGQEHWLRITVEDHGVGMSQETMKHVFEPFFTTKARDRSTGKFGTGLGLSVSHGIVRDHQGELSVESEPGEYTRFHVELPVLDT